MLAWLRDLTSRERRTMLACWGGWTLDGFDQQLYSYVVPTVIALWGMSTGAAGTIGTVTVVTSSFGGWFAGALADRFGRVRMLQIAILWYSVFTLLCGFAQNFEQLFILRGLHGLGFGGEWATGAVLMGVERASIGLRLLAELIAAGKLQPQIAVETHWSEIGTVAQRLIDRGFTGKAVLHI